MSPCLHAHYSGNDMTPTNRVQTHDSGSGRSSDEMQKLYSDIVNSNRTDKARAKSSKTRRKAYGSAGQNTGGSRSTPTKQDLNELNATFNDTSKRSKEVPRTVRTETGGKITEHQVNEYAEEMELTDPVTGEKIIVRRTTYKTDEVNERVFKREDNVRILKHRGDGTAYQEYNVEYDPSKAVFDDINETAGTARKALEVINNLNATTYSRQMNVGHQLRQAYRVLRNKLQYVKERRAFTVSRITDPESHTYKNSTAVYDLLKPIEVIAKVVQEDTKDKTAIRPEVLNVL